MTSTQPIFSQIRRQLIEGPVTKQPSLTLKLPLPYHLIPGKVRIWLAKILFRPYISNLRQTNKRQPKTYLDHSSDELIFQISPFTSKGFQWPEAKQCALVLSHDIDTHGSEKGIFLLHRLAKDLHLPQTFSVVGNHIDTYHNTLQTLLSEGVEIALHDRFHDNKVAFLPEHKIYERLLPLKEKWLRYQIEGFRSPSWYTTPLLWHCLKQLGFTYDMSALDSWSFFESDKNHGVGSLFPYQVQGLTILPNTIPFDLPLLLGYRAEEHFHFWKPKIDRIAERGGLLMFNAHPDSWYCGNSKMVLALKQTLQYILDSYKPACFTALSLAKHFEHQKTNGRTLPIPGTPPLDVILPCATQPTPSKAFLNPMEISKKQYKLKLSITT